MFRNDAHSAFVNCLRIKDCKIPPQRQLNEANAYIESRSSTEPLVRERRVGQAVHGEMLYVELSWRALVDLLHTEQSSSQT